MNVHPDFIRGDELDDALLRIHESLLLFRDNEISSVPYNRSILSGEEFIDSYDVDHVATPVTTTFYFPGGVPGFEEGYRRATIHDTRNMTEDHELDIQSLRRKIASLKLGKAVRERFNQSPVVELVEKFKQEARQRGKDELDVVSSMTAELGIPLATIDFRKIISHKDAVPGDSMAVLTSWAPIHPVRALRLVQASIREDEREETIL